MGENDDKDDSQCATSKCKGGNDDGSNDDSNSDMRKGKSVEW